MPFLKINCFSIFQASELIDWGFIVFKIMNTSAGGDQKSWFKSSWFKNKKTTGKVFYSRQKMDLGSNIWTLACECL